MKNNPQWFCLKGNMLKRQHSHPSKVEGGQDNSRGLVRTGNGYTGVSVLHVRDLLKVTGVTKK